MAPFIDTECHKSEYAQHTKQLPVGDYHICRAVAGGKPAVVACLERKTLPDFAASFKDGRYANVNKMLALRDRCGCQLYYIIEGPAFPSPNRRFSRIPYSNILSAITKLMVRHGIMVVQTEDQAHSAKRICEIMHAMEDETVYSYPHAPPGAGAATVGGAGAATVGGAEEGKETESGLEGPYDYSVPEVSLEKVEESDDDAIIKVWARLRGISAFLGKVISQSFSVAQLARGEIAADALRDIKTVTKRTLNSDALGNLLAVRSGNVKACTKILSGIRGVSPAIAAALIESAQGLARLCSYTVGALSIMKIPHGSKGQKLGEVRAKRIAHMLSYVGTRTTTESKGSAEAPEKPDKPDKPVRAKAAKKADEAATIRVADKIGPKLAAAGAARAISDGAVDEFLQSL